MASHEERLKRCLAGELVDRVPVSLWRHFPVEDQSPALLARAVVNFQETYDFDFVKITPSSSFCVTDWGSRDKWNGNPEGSCEYVQFPVHHFEDWKNIHPLSPAKGALAGQLECIKLIRQNLPKGTPIIQTIFNPLSQAKNLVGKNNLPVHMRSSPEEVLKALRVITETTIEFINSAKKLGIDGIFFAIQHAQAGILSPAEYDEFGIPFDLEILSEVKDLWLNVAHLHGNDVYFGKISQYPVDVLNWHDLETPPDLPTAKLLFPGAVCGGLRQWETLVNGTPDSVTAEAREAISCTESHRFILGTGCVLPITAPHSNILAARQSVEM
ncbi:MAG: uroporphyrinogen decarboxylase [Anaerolineae bacterium]|nr:uroporphyrinogen decarboxylase [Anaerolineae bacterium]